MALPSYLKRITKDQLTLVMEINDEAVIEAAKKIAFYAAMIDAAKADPLEDPQEQEAVLQFFQDEHLKMVEHYQQLVNHIL